MCGYACLYQGRLDGDTRLFAKHNLSEWSKELCILHRRFKAGKHLCACVGIGAGEIR